MRFLHLADVHLDTPFRGRSGELREHLRRASRDAFRRAVELALAEDVHAVLVAGDLFDGERLSFATERFLLEQLGRLSEAGIPTIYATGNHDPGHLAGRAHSLPLPEGVTVVSGPHPERVEVRDRDGRAVGAVTAAGHASAKETRDLAAAFPHPESSIPEVALLHAQVVGARAAEGHDPYAPTEVDTLCRAGYGYWALGHVHLRQRVSALPPVWYPGNLQGRSPRETGAKGALLVEMPDVETAEVEFRPLASTRWEELVVDGLAEVGTLEALTRAVEGRWRREREEDPGLPETEWVLRVALRGPTPLYDELRRAEDRTTLEEELAARLGILEVDVRAGRVHPRVDPEVHLERQDVLGEALRMLREAASEDEILELIAPEELAGLRPGEEAGIYLRSLAVEIEAELVSRMIAPEAPERS